jgi:hypothetical protein
MRLPTQRLTINTAEYLLLKPGLEVLANGLANARMGVFPHRHAFHNIDHAAADLYREQSYDVQMASRIIAVRAKLWELLKPRKVRLDTFEIAAAALALRLQKACNLDCASEAGLAERKQLASKLETYRKRTKRAAIAKLGAIEYKQAANRWKNFNAWLRFNLLQFKLPKRGAPWRAALWREQRRQLAEAIGLALEERLYEALDESSLKRVVTLLAASLRRSRHSHGLRQLLASPRDHADFMIRWVEKRVKPELGPTAPTPPWKAASDRAEKFQAFIRRSEGIRSSPPEAIMAQSRSQDVASAVDRIEKGAGSLLVQSPEDLLEALTEWLYRTVTLKFNFTREVCEAARYQIKYDLLDQYRKDTVGTSFEDVAGELCPEEFSDDAAVVIGEFAGWILGCLLALRREPEWIYGAIGTAADRAQRLKENTRRDR